MKRIVSDPAFREHFDGSLLQVFMYVTDECNLRCRQCYYKPWLTTQPREIGFDVAMALLREFSSLGAIKLSLLGGEPTMYGRRTNNGSPGAIVQGAKAMGFRYVRLVSNGTFQHRLLDDPGLRQIDEITFSIDGHTQEIHDALRGRGTYTQAVASLQAAVARNYEVHVTTCVHNGNIGRNRDGTLMLERAIDWAAGLGAKLINFHPLFEMNIPRDSWTEGTHIEPATWVEVFGHLRQGIDAGRYPIAVRLPQRFATAGEFEAAAGRLGFCPLKIAERIEVHPNGQIHSCALHNGTPIALARFSVMGDDVVVRWESETNEFTKYPLDFDRAHPCVVMQKDYGTLLPLCISFKPSQEEFVWKTHGWS